MQLNILIIGLYFSGSSAVYDLLGEYNKVSIMPGEFTDFPCKGLIGDHLAGFINKSNRSRIRQYVNSDLHYRYVWCNGSKPEGVKQFLRPILTKSKIFSKYYKGGVFKNDQARLSALRWLDTKLKNCGAKEEKFEIANLYLQKLKDIYQLNKPYIIFDQPIFTAQHQDIWPRFFDPFKLIVVYRDPRDQIAQLIKLNLIEMDRETPTRGIMEIFGSDRAGAIKYELATLKARYNNALKLQKQHGEDKVKIIRFEDLVTNYEVEKANLESFLGLSDEQHQYKKTRLIPEESQRNIGLYKDYLTQDELKLFTGFEEMFYKDKIL